VGVRIPDSTFVQALLEALGEPLLSSTLIMPGETEPRTNGWDVKDTLDHLVDVVIETGEDAPAAPTTVVDWSEGYPEVVREGAGDWSRFVA
jgi:tRNA A37 threonylcarbamoyladenosine synthetase subunit TsaC/SUA5/YrdC